MNKVLFCISFTLLSQRCVRVSVGDIGGRHVGGGDVQGGRYELDMCGIAP